MSRYTVAVLVRNQFGVLNRVTSLFRRRQFNINSLTVSETESADFSRITVNFEGEEAYKQQLINQLYKLPDVCSIKELESETTVSCELLLIKMENIPKPLSSLKKRNLSDGGTAFFERNASRSAYLKDGIIAHKVYKIVNSSAVVRQTVNNCFF